MIAASASATATGASSLRYSSDLEHRPLRPEKRLTGYTKFSILYPNCFSSTRLRTPFPVRALDPQRGAEEEENSSIAKNGGTALNSQDDLEYLGKVVAGSFAGAAVVKYGSMAFPEITRPNIIQALVMILTPLIVAVFLLVKQSRAEERS